MAPDVAGHTVLPCIIHCPLTELSRAGVVNDVQTYARRKNTPGDSEQDPKEETSELQVMPSPRMLFSMFLPHHFLFQGGFVY